MRLGIRLECSRKPDFGWHVAMIIDQGLKRLSWSVPRMLVWNAMLEAANGLECRAELTENLRIVIFFSSSIVLLRASFGVLKKGLRSH